ncbi:hypothetical protein LPMP_220340 [Leishmania panamensis]|uniref:Uncharacterized protein n=2 Tax=Leishmania guyanensis species complex TaxID=38579 RepID=A0A088RQT3_LEIPA|nr:hypothetical protein LPMP_220340 [Leishmania panamensis]AIN98328.1 hypothetical protein LPMP_220340 [Leishmania panamensis]
MNSASSGVCPSAKDAASEGLQSFMTELSRLETASRSRLQELTHAKSTERELSEHLAAVTFAAQKARYARLQVELDAAATQVRTEEARRESAEERQRLSHLVAQLERVNALSRSVENQKKEDQGGDCLGISCDAAVGHRELWRSLTCIHQHPRLSHLFLTPLVRLFTKLGAQYIASLGDTHLGDQAVPALHSLWSLDAFQVWLHERACGTLADDDMLALSFIANVADATLSPD